MATIYGFGDIQHTFVERVGYQGGFLPNYKENSEDVLLDLLPEVGFLEIDHWVGNQPQGHLDPVVAHYEQILGFKRFWNVDDQQLHSEYSALRTKALTDSSGAIKLSISEPAPGKRKSQNQEFYEYFGGPGVHHIALTTDDILKTVTNLQARGVQFLTVPGSYYDDLEHRLKLTKCHIAEDLAKLRELNVLVDCDKDGYLLQLFTKPLQDRPTHFIEIIQRRHHNGYGAGNFKALFEAIEREQVKRGNV